MCFDDEFMERNGCQAWRHTKNPELYAKNIFRKCIGDRKTTRNTLDILPGQIILVRRGMSEHQTEMMVSFISVMTKYYNK